MPTAREIKEVAHRRALLKSVGKILKDQGYANLGINQVAEEANVDKTFIYRKYKDFDGLLRAYIEKQDFWLRILEEIEDLKIEDQRSFMKEILAEQFAAVYKNEEFQQYLVWELGDKEGFTTKIAIERELMADKLLKQTSKGIENTGINLNMIYALFIAGIYYLILHRGKSTFCTIDITQEGDTQEFNRTIAWLVDVIFDKQEAVNKVEQIAIRAHKKGLSVDDIAEITELSPQKIKALID